MERFNAVENGGRGKLILVLSMGQELSCIKWDCNDIFRKLR